MTVRVMDLISSTPDDLPPRYGSDRSTTAIARIVDLVEGGRQLIVSLYGGAGVQIPATAVNWAGVKTAHVLLDPDTGRVVMALLEEVARESNSALIVITHDMGVAARASRAYELYDGVLHEVGDPSALAQRAESGRSGDEAGGEQAGDEAVAQQAQEATPSGDVTEEAERPEVG